MCAALTGIESNKYTIIAFVMAGLGVGLGAFLTLVYTPSVTTTTASSIGMNILAECLFQAEHVPEFMRLWLAVFPLSCSMTFWSW